VDINVSRSLEKVLKNNDRKRNNDETEIRDIGGTAGTRLIILLLCAMLGSLATEVATESTTTNLTIVRGYQSTTSPSRVVLMTIPGLGVVDVDGASGLSRIAFYPSVPGSLWWINGDVTCSMERVGSGKWLTSRYSSAMVAASRAMESTSP